MHGRLIAEHVNETRRDASRITREAGCCRWCWFPRWDCQRCWGR